MSEQNLFCIFCPSSETHVFLEFILMVLVIMTGFNLLLFWACLFYGMFEDVSMSFFYDVVIRVYSSTVCRIISHSDRKASNQRVGYTMLSRTFIITVVSTNYK